MWAALPRQPPLETRAASSCCTTEIEPGDEDAPDASIGLERGDGIEEIAVDQLGVAPGDLQLLARDDYLAQVAELPGERGVVPARRLAAGHAPAKLS